MNIVRAKLRALAKGNRCNLKLPRRRLILPHLPVRCEERRANSSQVPLDELPFYSSANETKEILSTIVPFAS